VQNAPDPQVDEKPQRRRFSAQYKLKILQEADDCTQSGQLGALLRREGLYSSHLKTWRRQRDDGMLDALKPKRRGRKPKQNQPLVKENEQLKKENQRLRERLRKSELVIDVQKKLCEVFESPMMLNETTQNNK
jgi:transposase-like protein